MARWALLVLNWKAMKNPQREFEIYNFIINETFQYDLLFSGHLTSDAVRISTLCTIII